jgi:hypothetical protein
MSRKTPATTTHKGKRVRVITKEKLVKCFPSLKIKGKHVVVSRKGSGKN